MFLLKINNLLLFRILISFTILLLLLFLINIGLELLRPNSIMVNINSGEQDNQPIVDLDIGQGFGKTILKSGEASYSLIDSVESLHIYPGYPQLFKDDFIPNEYKVKDGKTSILWTADISELGSNLDPIDCFVLFGPDSNAEYSLYLKETSWHITKKNGLLLARNPNINVQRAENISVLETVVKDDEVSDVRDLPPIGIDSLVIKKQDSEEIRIESITLKRYMGRFDLYLPWTIKSWEGKEILENFELTGEQASRKYEGSAIYLNPAQRLEYIGNFSLVYEEIVHSIAKLKNTLNILASLLVVIFFVVSGLVSVNIKKLKEFQQKVGYLLSPTFLLTVFFCFALFLLVLLPINILKLPFFILATVSGATLLYLNRHKLEQDENINFINSNKHIALLLFLIVAVLSVFVLSYNLGGHDLRGDEFQIVDAAAGYYFVGDYYPWDWLDWEPGENYLGATYYDRAFPHTFLIAQAYQVFGISEWSSRIISVVFGVIFIALFFKIAKYFTENKYLALLSVSLVLFHNYYIFIFRLTRMYALLIPLTLFIIYFAYKGIMEKNINNRLSHRLYAILYDNFNYNYLYLMIALFFIYFAYLIHINVLVILPSLFLFVLIMFFRFRENKYLAPVILGPIVLSLFMFTDIINRYSNFLSFFNRRNYEYIEFLAEFPFPWEIGSVLLVLGLIASLLLKGHMKNKLIYLYVIVLFSLFFFIFMGDRYAYSMYISHITPIAIILILFSCMMLLRAIDSRRFKVIFSILLLFYVFSSYLGNVDSLYGDDNPYGSFSTAYKVIIENYSPEKEVIFGQYLRTFYLQDLKHKDVKTVNMLNNKEYSFEQFMADLQKHESGWLTWETRKSYHLERDIIEFSETYFEKIHGRGVDDTKVEVFYYQQSDLANIKELTIDSFDN